MAIGCSLNPQPIPPSDDEGDDRRNTGASAPAVTDEAPESCGQADGGADASDPGDAAPCVQESDAGAPAYYNHGPLVGTNGG